ncbi:MAG TPA: hypothetical protein VGH15_15700 [Caulobacteraceae bacterium]
MDHVTFAWQLDGRIAGATDNLIPAIGPTSRSAAYGYTPSGRVMSGSGAWGSTAYAYDPSGNLTQNGATTMSVAAGSNRVTATAGGTTRALTYLAGGELSQDHPGFTYAYSYNAARRLVGVTKNSANAGVYGYDFAGRRVYRKTFGTGTPQTAYLYDEAGHVLEEENAARPRRRFANLTPPAPSRLPGGLVLL